MKAFVGAPLYPRCLVRLIGRSRAQFRYRRPQILRHVSATPPRASIAISVTQAVGTGILIADDIYGQLAVGGIGIAVGSILAVVLLGFIVRSRREDLELEIWDRDKIVVDEQEMREREIRIQKRIAQEKAERASRGIVDADDDDSFIS